MAALRTLTACLALTFETVRSSPVPTAGDTTQPSADTDSVESGTWTKAHDLPSALIYTAMTTLQNGSTLLVGGQTLRSSSNASSATQRYDPETNEWHAGPFMRTARCEHGLVTGQTGLVYAIGGVGVSSGKLDTVEVYSSANNSWNFVAPMPVKRSRFGATVLKDGSIFIAGGYTLGPTSSVYIYSPNTDSWAVTPSMSTSLSNTAATTLPDGRVFVAGGTDFSNAFDTAYLYNPTTKTWSNAAPMRLGTFGNGLVTLPSGNVLSVGGGHKTWVGGSSVEIYFPENNTWAGRGDMPFSSYAFGTAVLQNGSVLVAGGWTTEAAGDTLKTAYMWTDPSSGGSLEYRCVGSQSHCEAVPKGDGVPLEECEKVCGSPVNTYECIDSRCVKSPNGVVKDVCDRICRPQLQFLDF